MAQLSMNKIESYPLDCEFIAILSNLQENVTHVRILPKKTIIQQKNHKSWTLIKSKGIYYISSQGYYISMQLIG